MDWEGRRYLHGKWSTSELVHIAKAQVALEDGLARQARRVVICDTDALATSVWHRRYTGQHHRKPPDARDHQWTLNALVR